MLRAYLLLRNHGLLPVGGGWLEQTQQFLDAVALIDAEMASAGNGS